MFVGPRARNWALTGWIHLGAEDPDGLWNSDTMQFMVCQKERCPAEEKDNAGKEHWQLFVQFKKQVRTTAVLKIFKAPQWWNSVMMVNSTVASNIEYCTKEDTRIEDSRTWGQAPTVERKSSKLALAIQAFKAGVPRKQVALDHAEAYVRHGRQLEHWADVMNTQVYVPEFKLSDFKREPITDWSKTIVLWGKSNIGKSCWALAHFKCPLVCSHPDQLRHFDPLVHDGIVFDDIPFPHIPRHAKINYLDQMLPRPIHIRYGIALIPAHTKKIFTTNTNNGEIFGDISGDGALTRRMRVIHFEGSENPDCAGLDCEVVDKSDWYPHQKVWNNK